MCEWHAGYSTCSRKDYRHLCGDRTKSAFLGQMETDERYESSIILELLVHIGYELCILMLLCVTQNTVRNVVRQRLSAGIQRCRLGEGKKSSF